MSKSLIICADAHLRDMQFGRRDRGLDFQKALAYVIDQGIATGSPILFAGDLMDTTRPSPATMNFLLRQHRRLRAAGVPMYVVSGNHDYTEPSWIDVVQEDQTVESQGGIKLADNALIANIPGFPGVSIYGVPSLRKEEFLAVCKEWPAADILLCHQPIKEFCEFPMDSALLVEELPRQYKLVAVGDIHVTEVRTASHGMRVASPGSTELCSKGEPLEKFFMRVEVDANGALGEITTHGIPTRKVLVLRITTEDAMPEALEKVAAAAPSNPVVFIRYDSRIPNVTGRLHTVIDPDKAILRAAPFVTEGEQVFTDDAPDDELQLPDFLDLFLTPGTDLFKTAALMLQPNAKATDILDAYVENRMAMLTSPCEPASDSSSD